MVEDGSNAADANDAQGNTSLEETPSKKGKTATKAKKPRTPKTQKALKTAKAPKTPKTGNSSKNGKTAKATVESEEMDDETPTKQASKVSVKVNAKTATKTATESTATKAAKSSKFPEPAIKSLTKNSDDNGNERSSDELSADAAKATQLMDKANIEDGDDEDEDSVTGELDPHAAEAALDWAVKQELPPSPEAEDA